MENAKAASYIQRHKIYKILLSEKSFKEECVENRFRTWFKSAIEAINANSVETVAVELALREERIA